MLTMQCRFPGAMSPERKHSLCMSLFLLITFWVSLQVAQAPMKGGVCFRASDFVVDD